VAGANLRAALVAGCFLGAFPSIDFLAVCGKLFHCYWLIVIKLRKIHGVSKWSNGMRAHKNSRVRR